MVVFLFFLERKEEKNIAPYRYDSKVKNMTDFLLLTVFFIILNIFKLNFYMIESVFRVCLNHDQTSNSFIMIT